MENNSVQENLNKQTEQITTFCSGTLKLKPFDLKQLGPVNPSLLSLMRRDTGRSFICRDIKYYNKQTITLEEPTIKEFIKANI